MRRVAVVGLGLLVVVSAAPSQPKPTRPAPRLIPVAETKVLMEGLLLPNFNGLNRTLKDKPAGDTWTFARGQGLLLAEAGNLLLIRPPKTRVGQDAWVANCEELRAAGGEVSKAAAANDYAATRAAVVRVANACNKCHAGFQVPARVTPLDK